MITAASFIKADSHMLETDCWVARFLEPMKHCVPRMECRDGGYQLTVAYEEIGKRPGRAFDATAVCRAMECNAGGTSIETWLAVVDIQGVEKELTLRQSDGRRR